MQFFAARGGDGRADDGVAPNWEHGVISKGLAAAAVALMARSQAADCYFRATECFVGATAAAPQTIRLVASLTIVLMVAGPFVILSINP